MDLFVYGTLRSPDLMKVVSGAASQPVDATLAGYSVNPVTDHIVPMIRSQKDAVAMGVLYRDVSVAQQEYLDIYEGLFGYVLKPVTVVVAGEHHSAQMYFPPHEQPFDAGAWSLAAWEADHLEPAMLAAEELFALDPRPDDEVLRWMWPMIEKRAWSKVRGRASTAPAQRRHGPEKGDAEVGLMEPPLGHFFRLQEFEVDHKTFDDKRSGDLQRAALIGTDAALVLPYDQARDRVLLVEQIRMGPLMRHDANPWSFEPIAGMVDARETPEECARREASEEAGLSLTTLEKMFSYYASPGSSTDYFYCYLAACDLPSLGTYAGGLDTEAEDLRLHVMTFAEAMAMLDSGEVTAGPLFSMLYWLDRRRTA